MGSILIDGESFPEIVEIVQKSDFHRVRNRYIFEAAETLFNAGTPIDQITVARELTRLGNVGNHVQGQR